MNISDFLILKQLTVKDAMKKLDLIEFKILFIVGDNSVLKGSITDGDVRRYILNNGSLDSSVENACNRDPFYLMSGFDEEKAKKDMAYYKILFAPVVDGNNSVKNIFTLSDHSRITDKHNTSLSDIPVVIMAGGKGTRMEPFTNVLPKPLIPIENKTMVEHIINGYQRYDINDFFLTVNYKGNLIEAYFNGIEKDYNVSFLRETEFLGTASSLKLMKDVPDTFIVSNCDIIVKADYADVIDFHKKSGSVLTVLSSIQHQTIPYGVVEFENGGKVTNIEEKPEYSISVNTGVYILDKKAWEYIPDNSFFHMTHLIEKLIQENHIVMTYPVNENDYKDVGQWEEYNKNIKNWS